MQMPAGPLTEEDELFLQRALTSKLGRLKLQPWVQEGADSTEEDNKRHHFETPWSVMMVKAAGPLQGNLTPQQKVWLFRQHEAKLYEHHVHMYELAEKVRTCTRCNRRQVVFEENQECKSKRYG